MTQDINKILDPKSTALLVVYKQNAYLDANELSKRNKHMPENIDENIKAIDSFIIEARNSMVMVAWTQMTESARLSPLNISRRIRSNPDGVTVISEPGDDSYNFYGKVTPTTNESVIEKIRYDAFSHTDLDNLLRASNIKTLIFVGGYATRCVLATSFAANSLGYNIIVPKGLVMNQKEDTDELPGFYSIVDAILGYVILPKDILALWSK